MADLLKLSLKAEKCKEEWNKITEEIKNAEIELTKIGIPFDRAYPFHGINVLWDLKKKRFITFINGVEKNLIEYPLQVRAKFVKEGHLQRMIDIFAESLED